MAVLLRVRNVDLNASRPHLDILIAVHTFNDEFSSRESGPKIEITRDLDGGPEVRVRSVGNVNVGACGLRFDLYLDALELFVRLSPAGHNDVLRVSGRNRVAARLEVQANRAPRNELLLSRRLETMLSVQQTRSQQDKTE